ncbi:glycosyltransferase family 2 protein [Fredinandcohnia sp. QZ13]|uniref:glycosyltransferase family 2 protein n=1 Tax=Fredinandcohnia sp. QZ13 TaxID=3073144 RepID=UPI0028535DDF|nr:glycosyltransferase family 2 protein [Fredinandcohnia sp. QZ13]MDR4890022.1 glycosyltransferase family 2 protein [Fredinandcohnia sp. QZ13]
MDLAKKQNTPLVSVITPSYNSALFIEDTIKSVQDQTYTNWEMIIVDDVSTDNTVEIIKEKMKTDSRIKLIPLDKNGGAAIARNTAIKNASGKYIAFLDSDDLWVPTKLEKQVTFMERNGYNFTFTGYEIMTEEGELTGKIISIPPKINYNTLLKNTIIGCLTVMLNIEKLGKVQMPEIRTRQDLATWLSVLKIEDYAHGIQEPLARYRKVSGSISSNKIKAAKQNWKVYREIENLGLIKAAWVFVNYAFNSLRK